MPVALSAKFTGWIALPLDNSNYKPDTYTAPSPTDQSFEVRFLTARQFHELETALQSRDETILQMRDRLIPLFTLHIVGTRNMPDSKNGPAVLADLVEDELMELGYQILIHSRLGYLEAKKSKLPRSSGPVASAPDAGAASAATTSPAP